MRKDILTKVTFVVLIVIFIFFVMFGKEFMAVINGLIETESLMDHCKSTVACNDGITGFF